MRENTENTVLNLTPHVVRIYNNTGEVAAEYQTISVARAKQNVVPDGEIDGVAVVKIEYGEPEGLPDPQEGVYYIVSAITALSARAAGRDTGDLLLTSDPVRDEHGDIIGCRSFSRI